MNIDVFFKNDLQTSKTVELSMYPNIPGIDEVIQHKLLGHQLIETKNGYLLLLDLENPDTEEKYTYSFADIKEVDPQNFSQDFSKYYLYCYNRAIEIKKNGLRELLESGVKLTEDQHDLLNSSEEIDTYRILFKK
ncbi:hypothetical protein [Oceanobacillus jordanicus]|uniref:Uncharacterized protein n=1 Tax=Oceanobacillus jordanicus TaxID=2867266 RepID=A0AAW5B608_9BACI|nr:hypothetical protein [Oceanobacillus jordanicus]MCG3418979.1 hypothetical protein [Oceanobacillus jordanicus]